MNKSQEGIHKGFCHVDFDSTNSVRKAVNLNGKELNGRALKIDVAEPSKSNI